MEMSSNSYGRASNASLHSVCLKEQAFTCQYLSMDRKEGGRRKERKGGYVLKFNFTGDQENMQIHKSLQGLMGYTERDLNHIIWKHDYVTTWVFINLHRNISNSEPWICRLQASTQSCNGWKKLEALFFFIPLNSSNQPVLITQH